MRRFNTKRVWGSFLLGGLLCVTLSSCSPPSEPPDWSVYAVPATLRVVRDEASPLALDYVDLYAARGETEPFQIVVEARGEPVTGIQCEVSDLVHADGTTTLSGKDVRLYREYFLNVLQTSGGYDWIPRIEYPGPLLPFNNPYSGKNEPYGAPFDNGRIGSVGKPYFEGRPSAAFVFPTGQYTGRGTKKFVVQLEQDANTGQALFSWSDSWKKGMNGQVRVRGWNATGVPVPPLDASNLTQPVPLKDGVEIRFAIDPDHPVQGEETHHFTAYGSMNEVIWGDIDIPRNTGPGTYSGAITVTADGKDPVTLPLTLNVWNFELPRKKSITTAYHGWMEAGFYADNPEADWQFELLQHEHRIDTQRIHGHNTKWAYKLDSMDWTSFDKAAAERLNGTIYPDGVPMRQFSLGMYMPGNERHWSKIAGSSEENVSKYARLFATHLKDTGSFDRTYVYCKDEPQPADLPNIARDIRAFKKADPGWLGKFMITSRPTPGHPLLEDIDIWCMKYNWWVEPKVLDHLAAYQRKIWCYVANSPYSPNPGYHLDSLQGYEPRLIKWAAWKMGAEGFLYWATALDQAFPNPWTTPMNDFKACGDANLIYYGARNGPKLGDNATPLPPIMGPLPGFRLKQIREGLEDWEYLLQCERTRGRVFTERLVSQVYSSPGGNYGEEVSPEILDESWTQDPLKIYEIRKKVAEIILRGR